MVPSPVHSGAINIREPRELPEPRELLEHRESLEPSTCATMFPGEDLPNFCIKIRLEGKDGLKRVRIPYNPVRDTHESLLNAILERYLPEDDDNVDPSDFAVKLKEIGDAEWPIDIENTEDIALAIDSTPGAKTERHIKMVALIYLKSEPEPESDLDEASTNIPAAVTISETTFAAAAPVATAAGKQKLVSHTKATPIKRRKTGKSIGSAGGSKGSKLPVRARIIGSIAELHALGKKNPPRIHVAMFAGYSNAASKGFSNPLSALKTEGLITYPDKTSVALTAEGLASEEARAITPPRNNPEVHVRVKALLTPKQQQIFDLLAVDGNVYHRDEVAAAVGYSNPSSKGWSNSIGKMSSLGLLHYPKDNIDPKKKLLQLTEMCFPFSKHPVNDGTSSKQPVNDGTLRNQPMNDGTLRNQPVNDGTLRNQPVNDGTLRNQPVNDGTLRNQSMNDGTLRNQPVNDGTLRNQPMNDGTLRNQPMNDGTLRNQSMNDGTLRNQPMNDGTLRNQSMNDGTLRNQPMNNGTFSNQSMNDRTAAYRTPAPAPEVPLSFPGAILRDKNEYEVKMEMISQFRGQNR